MHRTSGRLRSRRSGPIHLASLSLLVSVLAFGFAQTPQEVAQTGFASSITVLVYDEFGDALGLGSGFAIAPGRFVTNAHVIAGAHTALVRPIGDADTFDVTKVEYFDRDRDLAVLRAPQLELPPIEVVGHDAPSVGDAVFAVGSPLGLEGTFTQGIVSGYRTLETQSLMQITAPISPGSSGGPVLGLDGRLVGIAVGAFSDGQNLNFAIPVTALATLLEKPSQPSTVEALAGTSLPPAGPEGSTNPVDVLDFGAFTAELTSFSFSVRNNLPRPITNVSLSIVAFDQDGFPIETFERRLTSTIEPGLGTRTTINTTFDVMELIGSGGVRSSELMSRLEIRTMSFEYAD